MQIVEMIYAGAVQVQRLYQSSCILYVKLYWSTDNMEIYITMAAEVVFPT